MRVATPLPCSTALLTVYNGVDSRCSPPVHARPVWTPIDTIGAVTESLQDHEVTQDIPEMRRPHGQPHRTPTVQCEAEGQGESAYVRANRGTG